jgi:putative nucleotidyltransferase with HDIG domain
VAEARADNSSDMALGSIEGLGAAVALAVSGGATIALWRLGRRASARAQRALDTQAAVIERLALAIEARDRYALERILDVRRCALALAEALGVRPDERAALETAALLHDIGKLGVPAYILHKPGRLTPEEQACIRQHPRLGAELLAGVAFDTPVLDAIRHHHERWDGQGYPAGLAGPAIPRVARILAVADVFFAMISDRAYRAALPVPAAIDEILKGAGTQFDPTVVSAFARVIESQAPETRSDASPAVDAIARTSADLWALYEVAEALSASVGLDETLETLAQRLELAAPGALCLILLAGPNGALDVRAASGPRHERLVGAQGQGQLRTVMRTRRAFRGDAEPADLVLAQPAPDQERLGLRSALIVPIVCQGETLGAIALYHPEADAFEERDQSRLERLAERLSFALFHAVARDDDRRVPERSVDMRQSALRALQERVARSDPRPFALLWLAVDGLHALGAREREALLGDIDEVLQRQLHRGEVVARCGDAFAVLVDAALPAQAEVRARALREAAAACDPDPAEILLRVATGFACFPDDGREALALLDRAEARARGTGPNVRVTAAR